MLYLRSICQIMVLCISIQAWLKAQYINFPLSANSAGMAGISVTYPGDWAIYNNQAGMANIKSLLTGVHFENHFLIAENSIRTFMACVPVAGGNIGLSFSIFGYEKFYESRTGLAFGKSFGNCLSGGIQINYLMVHQPYDYGNMHAVVPEGGLLAMPLKDLYIGFHIFNPAGQKFLQNHDQQIPVRLKTGLGYAITDHVFMALEAEKATGDKFNIKAGAEYEIIKNTTLRMGVSTAELSKYALGIGYQFKTFRMDFAISHHPWLGFSPYLSLTYHSKSR